MGKGKLRCTYLDNIVDVFKKVMLKVPGINAEDTDARGVGDGGLSRA